MLRNGANTCVSSLATERSALFPTYRLLPVRGSSSLSDLRPIYCGGPKSAHFSGLYRSIEPLFASKVRKTVLDFPLASSRSPKSDRLLADGAYGMGINQARVPHGAEQINHIESQRLSLFPVEMSVVHCQLSRLRAICLQPRSKALCQAWPDWSCCGRRHRNCTAYPFLK